ncbi:MAG TPA: P-type conjugative transfer ATPase TrbB [Phenylobacterium sp.]|uniref:P-type conjugative transfer ATPase TrbB n=1 Tax=Phenylobacterium sp. TaxID=1871053 RepID=UPI002F95C5D4
MEAEAASQARRHQALDQALGEVVLRALAEPGVVEVLVNPDGRVIVDVLGQGRRDLGVRLTVGARERVIRLVAAHAGQTITPSAPRLSGALPSGERFQAFLPPVCAQPAFSIRKRPQRIWTLKDYVAQRAMSPEEAATLGQAVCARRNILVSGGAGSGKTTLANALLAEPAFASDRVFLIEDVRELQCSAWDQVATLTRRPPDAIAVVDLVRDALRMRPDRIVVGELRDGASALETLKAWNTGHPGGLATIHANSALEALSRLEDLLAEVMASSSLRLIERAVDLIVHVARTDDGRRIEGLLWNPRSAGSNGQEGVSLWPWEAAEAVFTRDVGASP